MLELGANIGNSQVKPSPRIKNPQYELVQPTVRGGTSCSGAEEIEELDAEILGRHFIDT